MFIGVGNPIPRIANLPGVSRPGGGGGGGGGGVTLPQIDNLYSYEFDGVGAYFDAGDSDTFSFGNGTDDSPFSISAWINMNDATRFRIVSKFNSTSNNEYIFTVSGSDLLTLNLYDESSGGFIGKKYSATLTSFQGQWIHVACTYDGTSSSDGIKLYLNGLQVDNTPNDSGSYTAMENSTQPLLIGQQAGTYSNGYMDEVAVFNTELSADQVQGIYNATTTGKTADLSSLSPVAWYRMGD